MIETQEIELKLEIPAGEVDAFRAAPLLGDPKREPEDQRTTYFDSPKGDLRKAGYSLRLRRKGGACVQTVKRASADSGGFSSRAEWEQSVDGPDLDFDALRATPVGKLLSKREMRKELQPVSETEVRRTTWLVRRGQSMVELILDEGRVVGGGREEPIREIELELKRGARSDLFVLAKELGETLTLRMGVMSKSERGFRLLENRPARVRKAEKIRLDRGMSIALAFGAIVQSCLRHFRLNEPLIARDMNARALHQCRVAMRRLRSALTLFKPVLADSEFGRLRAELRWFTAQLGEARNLDVLLATRSPEGEPADAATQTRLRQARREAYARVQEALAGPRLPRLILDLVAWSEVGAWRRGGPAGEPIAGFAADRLERGWKRVRRQAKTLRQLDPETRHGLRIRTKQLRYAAEFFAGLAPKGRRRHQKAFVSDLARLQDVLGRLNDIETQDRLAPLLFQSGEAEREREVAALLGEAERVFMGLRETGPYWR